MGMVMKFPNRETRNLLIEVFNYMQVCSSEICYTSGFSRQRRGHKFDCMSVRMCGCDSAHMMLYIRLCL